MGFPIVGISPVSQANRPNVDPPPGFIAVKIGGRTIRCGGKRIIIPA